MKAPYVSPLRAGAGSSYSATRSSYRAGTLINYSGDCSASLMSLASERCTAVLLPLKVLAGRSRYQRDHHYRPRNRPARKGVESVQSSLTRERFDHTVDVFRYGGQSRVATLRHRSYRRAGQSASASDVG